MQLYRLTNFVCRIFSPHFSLSRKSIMIRALLLFVFFLFCNSIYHTLSNHEFSSFLRIASAIYKLMCTENITRTCRSVFFCLLRSISTDGINFSAQLDSRWTDSNIHHISNTNTNKPFMPFRYTLFWHINTHHLDNNTVMSV